MKRRTSGLRLLVLATTMAFAGLTVATAPATASTTPTITNAGFESNSTGTATPSGWTASGSTSCSYTEAGGRSGSYRLAHYCASAYTVDTYQQISNITPGYYTFGVWIRSDDTGGANWITMSSCGGSAPKTYVPVVSDGKWLHIVAYTYVSSSTCYIDFHTAGAAGSWTNYDDVTFTAGSAPVAIRGGDVSSLYRSEAVGGVYYTSAGVKEPALQILKNGGMNYARLRTWVNPADGFDNEAALLTSAREAAAYGMPILLDLHYSDTWADPGTQTIPAAWSSTSPTTLESQVYAYSKKVVGDLAAQGTAPAMVQVGNEINGGMLWSLGSTSHWSQLAALLKQGVAGVKAASSSAKIMLHLASSDDLATLETWYTNAVNYGVPFDVIGLSYYGYWHGRLDVLQTDLNGLAAKYGKQVVVAETAYPFTMANGDSTANSIRSDNTTLDAGYTATAYGQQSNFRDVLSVVQAVPNGLGLGAFYWEPTWTAVTGNGWSTTDPTAGDGWENQAAFDYNDKALPVVGEFAAR
ncbi:MAG: glycosyl hydrolase 53 family protein [Catenulisporales bacterium]|nr:glycosyl hydrolase 53 family protein [Catenulisporales bacterium]